MVAAFLYAGHGNALGHVFQLAAITGPGMGIVDIFPQT